MKTEDNRVFYALVPIALVATVFALSVGSTVILWIICSFFLFALIDPWMQKFMGKGVNPIFLAIALVLIAFALIGGVGFLVYRTSYGIVSQMFSYKSAIFQMYEDTTSYVSHWTQAFTNPHDPALTEKAGKGAAEAAKVIGGIIPQPPPVPTPESGLPNKDVSLGVLSGLNSVVSILSFSILTPLLTFFMVAERELFSQVCSRLLNHVDEGKRVWKKVTDAITAYFLGNIILILVSFPVFVLTFGVLGVKSFLSLGLLSAILNLVPFLGFVLASILPTLDLLMNGGHAGGIIALITICCFTHFTIANVVTPKLLGAKLNLNATASTIALIAWGELWGPIGLLLAIPLTALIKIWLEHSNISSFEFLAAMMDEDRTASERMRFTKARSKK